MAAKSAPIERNPMIHPISELLDLREQHFLSQPEWPFMQVGVFPTSDTPVEDHAFCWFNYTVGLGDYELHVPAVSVEGRALGNELTGAVLNLIALGVHVGAVEPGHTVRIPLGVPSVEDGEWERDADAFFWLHHEVVPSRTLGANMTDCEWALPIRWSSPLGWPEGAA